MEGDPAPSRLPLFVGLVRPLSACSITLAGRAWAGYLTSVTNGGRIVTWQADREADIRQAKVFHSLLAEHRDELCNRLDEQAIKLLGYQRNQDSDGARRKRRRIKEIGTEVRDIDRMMRALSGRLLGTRQDHRPT
jgi:hypothetical protein